MSGNCIRWNIGYISGCIGMSRDGEMETATGYD